ncbi:phage tail protein [Devosia submarina]|uniref:phage tail protein n=1 Tax=Devosia submarina TaxID=1173082 RepID=UPI000D340266|nr:phage tail protein [Devosia submarina]
MDMNRWPPRPWEATTPRRAFAIFTAITGYVASALVGIGLSTALAGVAASVIVGAAFLGVSMLLTPRPPVMKTPQAQAVVNQSTGARLRGYGYALLGGTRAFFDSKDGFLYQVIMMHSGWIDFIEHFRVGDQQVTLNGDGDVTAPDVFVSDNTGNPYIRIRAHTGSPNQPADAMMMDAWPGVWTSAHRLRGIAYLATRFRSPRSDNASIVYPESYNTPVRALCRLSRIWDPRNGNTVWSDNPALCILDYLTHPDGFKKTRDDIDLNSFAIFANLCDEAVPLAAGGTEKRYRLWGVYSLNDEPEDILRKMRATCDAELYQNAQGKIAIRGGKWEAPTVTITDRDILGHSMEQGNNRFAAFNELKIMYTSPLHDFQTMEATAWIDTADQDERGPIPSDLDLDFVPSPSQARRLAKIHISKSNPRWKGRVKTNLLGLNALGERTIALEISELEIDEAFYVAGFSIASDLTSVEIEVMTISEAAYQWNPASEEGQNPAIPQDTTPDLSYPVPEGLELSVDDDGIITATVDDPARSGLALQVQIRAGAGSTWQEMDVQDDNVSAVFGPVADGTYEVRARWTGALNAAGEWAFPYVTITVPVPPPPGP